MRRDDEDDAPLNLRSERATNAFSDFCFAWLDAGRQITFGSARVMLRTADDLTAANCSAPRSRTSRSRRR
ncbi:hypothetical protein DD559_02775 [Sphingomonas pokkalii]|uniref:Uncharacterized protein n=1 Tax=Sphingomonas pokkalii TaxID=2175090 RepID=A0A2U0SAL2_9SPHN|nr:hypothetical protein DD559_02775 [Sphingomonas pokkalii]